MTDVPSREALAITRKAMGIPRHKMKAMSPVLATEIEAFAASRNQALVEENERLVNEEHCLALALQDAGLEDDSRETFDSAVRAIGTVDVLRTRLAAAEWALDVARLVLERPVGASDYTPEEIALRAALADYDATKGPADAD